MIEESLENLGLAEKEITLYLALLRQGRTTPTKLHKLTGINRTTIYGIAKELIKKGLVAEDLTSKGRPLFALPPSNLKNLTAREEREILKKKETARAAVAELNTIFESKTYSIPQVNFVIEEEINNFLYEQTPKWHESILKYDKTLWGFSSASYVSTFLDYMNWFWENAPKDLELKILGEDAKVETSLSKKFPKRQVKVPNPPFNFTASTIICGDYILLVTTKEHPYYLIEIYDAILAENMRGLYKRIWGNF